MFGLTLPSSFRSNLIKIISLVFILQALSAIPVKFIPKSEAAGVPATLTASRSTTGLVSISWTAPSDTTNLTGYKIYVDSSGNGKFLYQTVSSSTLSTKVCFPFTGGTLISVASITSGVAPTYNDNNPSSANWKIKDMGAFGSISGTSCAAGVSTSNPTYDYSIAYNANNGSGTMASVSGNDWTVTLAANAYTRSGYTFQGWCTVAMADGVSCSGTSYTDQQTITLSANLTTTLYAMWSAANVIVTFHANFDSDTTTVQTIPISTNTNLTANPYTRAGYSFLGWSTTSTGSSKYSNSQSVNLTSNLILYGVWLADGATATYGITYEPGGGSGLGPSSPDSATAGGTFQTPSNTYTYAGYTFAGWFDSTNNYAALSTYPSAGTVSGPVTLTATWTGNQYSYNGNTASGTMSSQTYAGSTLSALSNGFTSPNGYSFGGWCSAALASVGATCTGTTYHENDDLPTPGSATVYLYAIWTANAAPAAPVYVPTPPTVTSISASEVCALNSELTINGTYLSGATATVDGVAARVISSTGSQMVIALPSAAPGTKTIKVTNADGSATTTVKYTFVDRPEYVNFIYPETFKDRAFSYTFTATNVKTYSIIGTLPAGLTLNSSTGEISGTPTVAGDYTFTIVANNICANEYLIVYMFVDKAIPDAFTCSVAFNVPTSDNITEQKLINLKNCLSKTTTLSPKYIDPVIFISGGIPAGLTPDQALTHPRYLPILDLIKSMNLNAQIYLGAFNGSTDSVQLNVYWPEPS